MPSNYTQNYQLNQWEADDRVQRTDFNADNAKIDAALAQKCEIVTGTYTGDGEAQRDIYLGRKPKAVYVCKDNGITYVDGFNHGGLALPDAPLNAVTLTNTGFTVYYKYFSSYSVIATNQLNATHHYIAFF